MRKSILVGLFASLVFVATSFKFIVPIPGGYTMIHLGHVFCLVSGFLLGPVAGGVAAGVGSCLFDLFDPIFFASAPFSLIFKFILSFLCGTLFKLPSFQNKNFILIVVAVSTIASFAYLLLHLTKLFVYNFYYLRISLQGSVLILSKSFILSLIKDVLSIFIVIFVMRELQKRSVVSK